MAPWQSQEMAGNRPPLVIGGAEFSYEDDIENMMKLSEMVGQVFYTTILAPNTPNADEALRAVKLDVWELARQTSELPSLALGVAMCLYNYFYWEGPHNVEINSEAVRLATHTMYLSITFSRCNDPALHEMNFFILQCHLRWRYLIMLAAESGRHLVLQKWDFTSGAQVMRELSAYFSEMHRVPHQTVFQSPYDVNFNFDYYPAVTMQQGPVWQNPLQDVPIASFLEANYLTIRGELEGILNADKFTSLDAETRNAETQFGPRGDDWLTAYMFRKGEAPRLDLLRPQVDPEE